MWREHDVGTRASDDVKRLLRPDLGSIEVHIGRASNRTAHALLVYTAILGGESRETLEMLSAVTT
ncbi:hypothetical protein EF294_10585 [Gordonia oryzae]|uniref:Uncharacterized protein n=1 Tax=Gordonia oryzae TaxID=2487349 RepID=A0A3N4GPR9_9ACTN|nr:hypothetical protein [Gordonia oryzae]RPA61081.1 hypothetical protein EF294_10585 [Gordonia oryzae]